MSSSKEKLLSKLALIQFLKKCPKDTRSHIIGYLNSDGINVLSETIHNVLRKDSPIKNSQKKRSEKNIRSIKKCCFKLLKEKEVLKRKEKI